MRERCTVSDCENEVSRGGLCAAHAKRLYRGQSLSTPLATRPKTPFERCTEAALAYANADDDEAFNRARDTLRKAIAATAATMRSEVERERISVMVREMLEERRARGLPIGRPRKFEPEDVLQVVQKVGTQAKAASLLQVSLATVRRAVRKARRSKTPHL